VEQLWCKIKLPNGKTEVTREMVGSSNLGEVMISGVELCSKLAGQCNEEISVLPPSPTES